MIKIILVDDEPLALEYLSCLLADKEDYQVIGEYTDAVTAMQEAGSQKPDIVISDICMDGVDGLQMIEQMRTVWGKQITFVVVSGYQKFDYAQKAMGLGVRDYLLKPVMEKELMDVLNKIKAEIEEMKHRDIVLEKVDDKKKFTPSVSSGVLKGLVDVILKFQMERAEQLLEKLLVEITEEGTRKDVWDRHMALLFRMLDEKLKYKNGELQILWQRRREKFGLNIENVHRTIRLAMLQIIEEKEIYADQPVIYMKLYMQEYYKEDILLQTFADKFYMNKAYLGQKFKKATGMSVNDYLQKQRILEAIQLAKTTELSWQEIAFKVGYGNYISFLKYFAKQEGVLPSDYKR